MVSISRVAGYAGLGGTFPVEIGQRVTVTPRFLLIGLVVDDAVVSSTDKDGENTAIQSIEEIPPQEVEVRHQSLVARLRTA